MIDKKIDESMLEEVIIPKFVRLEEVKTYCTLFGKKKLIQLIRDKEIRGGRLPEDHNKTRPWFVDLHSLLDFVDRWMNDHQSMIDKKLDEYFSRPENRRLHGF